jgi:hypothetical protein
LIPVPESAIEADPPDTFPEIVSEPVIGPLVTGMKSTAYEQDAPMARLKVGAALGCPHVDAWSTLKLLEIVGLVPDAGVL